MMLFIRLLFINKWSFLIDQILQIINHSLDKLIISLIFKIKKIECKINIAFWIKENLCKNNFKKWRNNKNHGIKIVLILYLLLSLEYSHKLIMIPFLNNKKSKLKKKLLKKHQKYHLEFNQKNKLKKLLIFPIL